MRKISIKGGQKVRLYLHVIAQKWSNPGVSNMKPTSQIWPASQFYKVRDFGFRLCCTRSSKVWITLLCGSDGFFLLLSASPLCFDLLITNMSRKTPARVVTATLREILGIR